MLLRLCCSTSCASASDTKPTNTARVRANTPAHFKRRFSWSTRSRRWVTARSITYSFLLRRLVVFLSGERAAAPDILRRRPPGGPVLAFYCLRPHPKKTGASPDNRCRLVRRLQFGYNSRMRDFLEGRNSRNFLVELEGFEPSTS